MTSRVTHLLILAVFATPALAQTTDISFKTTEVATGIYMLEGVGGFTGGNLGLLEGPDGAILIDDGMQQLFAKTSAAINKKVGKVDYVINTHAHGDHIGGNQGMSQSGATLIGHKKLRKRLQEEGITGPNGQMPASKEWLPKITYSRKLQLHLNGHDIQVIHVEHAHTDGDSIVYFPKANVIHSGDIVFNGLFPYIDLDSGGSVHGYVAAQKKILELADADTRIIPGHGPLASRSDIKAANDMLMDACKRIEALIKNGKTEAEILAMNPLADYDADWSWGFITTEKMTKTLIRDLME